jgi:hypothetical protein
METKGTFQFTLQTESGTTYTYEGTLESLYKHLKANEGVRVLEDKTRFA